MKFIVGTGTGIVVGACVGKVFRPQIEREIEAFKRDWEWEQRGEFVGIPLQEWIEYRESYPSVYRRTENVYYKFYRGFRTIREVPFNIKEFIHRGRHGWAPSDTWNVDYYVVDVLIPLLKHYKEHNMGHPADQTEEEHDAIIDEIVSGFRQYRMYLDNWHTLEADDYKEATELAMTALADAFSLLGVELPGIWI